MAVGAYLRTIFLASATLLGLVRADACNPLSGPCPVIPGLPSRTYSIDFSQQTTTPNDWILADFATVGYGAPNGADFTFAKRYDAPYIWSRFYVLFGRIEVVLRAAPGTGIITSAVMMSDDLDEIDWEWSGNNFAGASGKVQTNFFGKGIAGYYDRGSTPAVTAPQDQFHTYALDWSPDALTWSIDGQSVRTLKNSHATSGDYQYPQTPSRLHLGVWCAGDPGNNDATVAWAGGYTNFSLAPFSAYVKSVKITTPNPCSTWQYPSPFDGTYQSVRCTNQTITNSLPCTYTVVQGDDGYKIAKTLGVTFDALEAANANVNFSVLLIGQFLNVPGGNCTMPSIPVSVVPTTDSLSTSTDSTSSIAVTASGTSMMSLTSTTSTAVSSSFLSASDGTPTNSTAPSRTSGVPSTSSVSLNSTSTQAPLPKSYTVATGDYGYVIATKLGCSFDDLKAANPGLDWDKLMVGQILNVAGQSSAATRSYQQSPVSNPSSGTYQSVSQPTKDASGIVSTPPAMTTPASSACISGIASSVLIALSSSVNAIVSGSEVASAGTTSNSSSYVSTSASREGATTGSGGATSTVVATSVLSSSPTNSNTPLPTSKTTTSPIRGSDISVPPSHSSSYNTDITNPVTSTHASKIICNQDNCLRNMIDPRYSSAMFALCSGYTATTSHISPLPTFLGGCSKDEKRVSSACSCLVSSFASPTGTPAITSPVMRAGTPSWRLKRSPLRWERVRA